MPTDVNCDLTAQLPTLDRLSHSEVLDLPQPVLRAVLRRCLDEANRPDHKVTAFNNYVTAECL